jgi:hypothetical protein
MATPTKYSPAFARAQEQLASTRRRLALARGNATGKGSVAVRGGAVVVGGALGGAIAAKVPEIAGIDPRFVFGLGLGAVGAFALKGKAGEGVMLLGAGILADAAGDMAETALSDDGAE